jgi:hypothetical protein
MQNPFLKKQLRAPNVQDIFPVIQEDSNERRHVDFVAGSSVQYNLCNSVTGSDSGNVEHDLVKHVLWSQAENSSYASAYYSAA